MIEPNQSAPTTAHRCAVDQPNPASLRARLLAMALHNAGFVGWAEIATDIAADAARMERALDELVRDAVEDARFAEAAPVVVRFPGRAL